MRVAKTYNISSSKLKGVLWLVGLIVISSLNTALNAQAYYTQLDNVEPFLSPALNGMSPNKDLRVQLSYRSNNLNANAPFHTAYLTVDGRAFARYTNQKAWLGWGVGGLYDVAGKGALSTTSLYVNTSAHIMITPFLLLSGGIGVGLNNKAIGALNQLSFPVQWQGSHFNLDIPNQEQNVSPTLFSWDIRAGLNVSFLFSNRFVLTAGASVQNINEPTESFFASSTPQKNYRKYGAFLQVYNTFNDVLNVKTSFYYTNQNQNNRFFLGTSWDWYFSNTSAKVALVFGGYYRSPAILSPSIGFIYKNARLTIGYDLFFDDASSLDYFYRSAIEGNASYFTKFSDVRYEELIIRNPSHF